MTKQNRTVAAIVIDVLLPVTSRSGIFLHILCGFDPRASQLRPRVGPFEHDMGYESSTYFYDPEMLGLMD